MDTIDILGTLGSILILLAYYLISKTSDDKKIAYYQFINILGAISVVIYSYKYTAYVSLVSHLIWIAIAGKSISKSLSMVKVKTAKNL